MVRCGQVQDQHGYAHFVICFLSNINIAIRQDKVRESIFALVVGAQSDLPLSISVVSICAMVKISASLPLSSCTAWFRADKWIALFSITVIDGRITYPFIVVYADAFPVMMLLRTWVLWRRSRVVLVSLGVLLVV